MLTLYRYMLENEMRKLNDIHEPYQSNLREEYQAKVANSEITSEDYERITGEAYPVVEEPIA